VGNKILLLGANGFIGNYLQSVFDVIPITREDCELTDLSSVEKMLKNNKPDIIINCAANLNHGLSSFNVQHFNDNIKIFLNLYHLRNNFAKLINFGSGAEFDRSLPIDNAKEIDITKIKPKDHYGLSKNIISNLCLGVENFYTLRVFGCFHSSEKQTRVFKKMIHGETVLLEDRYFDYIWLEDIQPIVDFFIKNSPKIKDINLVRAEKFLISQLIDKFKQIHNLNPKVIYNSVGLNYTGSSELIDSFNFQLTDFDSAIKRYIV
jgi:GDP-L-fucose synthase